MWNARYWNARYWNRRFWAKVGFTVIPHPVERAFITWATTDTLITWNVVDTFRTWDR